MACGCVGTCNCVVVGGDGITVDILPGGTIRVSSSTSVGGVPTFIQSTQPAYAGGPYVWYQTDPDTGDVIQVFVETEGAP